ncbi:hypothetical protein GCM10012320_19060 [Sinomonas cellulolyticus]|uniref:Uncharacterized protein n=1 Tax=Sinomonas cellulolyticus TaxID=2801916 RepID=A0ABS1K6H0_9MICC|nr:MULTISPECIES: hypothetical protein [Sinomonas]MBL0707284.1 hypothetical protein [Sinomonas cellulolyticus]GHG50434.1 hypothetical protein GCM10012320_19060 [Sinomonas sp. KCTC 49339]
MSTATRPAGTGLHTPRLTGAQLDSLEEAVERRIAGFGGTLRPRPDAPASPSRPEAAAGWARRAVDAVVRWWREAADREAGLDAERDEVRRQLLADQPRLW